MKNNTGDTLRIYWQHAKKHKLVFLTVSFFVFFGSAINAIIPIYFKKFFDILEIGGDKEAVAGGLLKVLLVIAIFELSRWVFWRMSGFFHIIFESRIMADLSNTCFSYLHKHSFSYFANTFTGSLVKKVNYFVNAFEVIADIFFWNIVRESVALLIIISVLMMKNYFLGLAVTVWLIIFFVFNLAFSKHKFKYDVLRNEAESETSGFLADTITNSGNIKLFNGYGKEVKSFAMLNEKVRKLRKFSWNLEYFFESIQTFLMIILQVGVFYLAIQFWKKDIFTIGDFVLLQSYVMIVIMNVWDFGKVLRRVYQSFSNAEEMTVILKTPHEIVDVKNARRLKVSRGEIVFDNVSFYYHQTRKILEDFNLRIRPGEKVALIGPSGAGKSTVARLILRNYDISSGKILIDGQDVSRLTQESLWKNVGLVPQDPILFHRSLKENIRYGRPDANDEEVVRASKLAHCHEFINNFSEGYDSYVGERGVKLSGGERQRVAIARAILKNAPILVLDEATSSLDSQSEKYIQDALKKLMAGKTVLVIAHRLSTIKRMDRIIYIDEGKIKEEGTHEELGDRQGGFYNHLWKLQAGGFIE